MNYDTEGFLQIMTLNANFDTPLNFLRIMTLHANVDALMLLFANYDAVQNLTQKLIPLTVKVDTIPLLTPCYRQSFHLT